MSTDSESWYDFLYENAEFQCKQLSHVQHLKDKLGNLLLGAELEKTFTRIDGSSETVYACITPDLLNSSQVRVTEYDENGLMGHHCHNNVDDALEDCVKNGFRKLASVSFNTIALTPAFQEGCRRIEEMHRCARAGS